MIKRLFISSLVLIMLSSCVSNDSDISSVEINSKLVRFDSIFYKSENLHEVKKMYPLMFPKGVEDSVWVSKSKNEEDLRVLNLVDDVFGDFKSDQEELIDLFKHFKYYLPKFKSPDVYTILSDFDFEYPVLYSGDRLFVSLDMYLGANSTEYDSFPLYLKNNFRKERIRIDAGDAVLRTIVSKEPYDKTMVNEMIYNGKLLYINKLMNPEMPDNEIIGYTEDKFEWCENKEVDIWTFMVIGQYLYSSDPQLKKRFIDPAPFSKFFLDIDRESPGRIGAWLGWKIVDSYMKHNDVSLEELILNKDSKSIFVNSKYKPRK